MARRLYALALATALAGAGCRDVTTEPFHSVTDPAPTGLPVAATLGPTPANAEPLSATVTASGDSVVVTYVYGGGTCGLDFSASAGVVAGALVVTHVTRFAGQAILCMLSAPRVGPTFRLTVLPAVHGRLEVVLRQRMQHHTGSAEFHERELVRKSVTLR